MSDSAHKSIAGTPKGLRLFKTVRRLLAMAHSHTWAAVISLLLILIAGPMQGAVVPFFFGLTLYSVTGELKAPGLEVELEEEAEQAAETGDPAAPAPIAEAAGTPATEETPDAAAAPEDKDLLTRAASRIVAQVEVGSKRIFSFFLGLLIAVYLLKCIVQGGQIYFSQLFAQRVICALRARLHAHLMRLSSSFYSDQRTGDLMSRATNDVGMLQRLVSTELVEATSAPMIALSSLVLMFTINAKLTLIMLSVSPFVAYAISRGSKKMRAISRQVQRRLGALNSHLQERLSAVRVVQLFTREDYEIERFGEINEKNMRAALRAVKVHALLNPGVEFIAFFGMMIALFFAGMQMMDDASAFPEFMLYIVLSLQIGTGLTKLGKVRLTLDQALAAGERIFEILDTESEVAEPPDPLHLPRLEGRILFDQVSFAYPSGEEVLKDINLQISAGEVVALVGPSGAGKTSLVNLIPRFYDPSSGHIEIDGYDIRRASLHSLRGQIGIVPQETHLFAGTIYENILYGRLEASQDEVVAAAKAANAHDFISAMPKGYAGEVGERGLRLSGGQRQRIAIARALLKDPRILIMDEPTSSLDMKSEGLVLDALARLMVGRTSVVIAHRPSTIKNADRILVLSEGMIIEEGSHAKLLAAGGLYAVLYEGQFPTSPQTAEMP